MRVCFSLPLLLFLSSVVLSAQTITTEPLAQSAYCAGETITVNYTLTGAVNPGNAFILQLSNPDGGFDDGFQNLGSIISTQSGAITTPAGWDVPAGAQYRLRVIASNPRVDGSDNGSDIAIDHYPNLGHQVRSGTIAYFDLYRGPQTGRHYYAFPGDIISLDAGSSNARHYWWNFGVGIGASPEQTGARSTTVSYSTPGAKNVLLLGYSENALCQVQKSFVINVLPTQPVLPADVRIIQTDETLNSSMSSNVWVCPGGVCRISREGIWNDAPLRIYVEAGGSVIGEDAHLDKVIIYMRSGSSIGPFKHIEGAIVQEPGASIVKGDNGESMRGGIKVLPGLTFDYSNVPPNGCPSLAPYTVQIKPDTRSIHTPEQDENSNAEYWLHNGGMLTSTGNGNTYYVEAGGRLVVNGVDSKIYVKDGGTVDVQQGSGHRIFYETKATLLNTGNDPILLPSSGITYTGQVSSVDVDATVGGSSSLVQIRPNPIRSRAEVRVDGSLGEINRVEVYDYVGRKAYEVEGVGVSVVLEMGSYPRGVYHVRVVTRGGVVSSRIVLE